ncbi:MAG: low specificity L-threonine aldolase [Candidatus Cloacimonadaceae bacterium]
MHPISFGSDNHSGAHPLIMQAVEHVNTGYWHGYGEEEYTEKVQNKVASLFGKDAKCLFLMTGTGANVLALQSLIKSYEAVFCAETAHINMHEAGAVQKFTQARLIVISTPDGKLTPEMIAPHISLMADQHMSQPRIISISQSTEYGTVYSLAEIKTLSDFAHAQNLFLHMDGARLANAAVSLNCSLQQMTTDSGVDVVSLGATKNGCLFGEALIFIHHDQAAHDAVYYRKQSTQLISKMRYVTAQMEAYIENDLWKQNAVHANQMAQLMAEKLKALPQVTLTQPVPANAVFAILPAAIIPPLQAKYHFYLWNEHRYEVRLMCSWDTTPDMIEAFIEDIKSLLA